MTYGEAHTEAKVSLYMEDGKFKTKALPLHDPRMPKEEAVIYYNKKYRETFLDLGFVYKVVDDFEKRLELAFIKVRATTNRMLQHEAKKNLMQVKATR